MGKKRKEREFTYDAVKVCTVTVKARSRKKADRLVAQVVGVEESIGIQYGNGVHLSNEVITGMPEFVDVN